MICYGCMNEISENVEKCPICGFIKGSKAVEIIHLNPGTELGGRYILGKVVGCGGFGVTYIAWDSLLEKKVAVKEFLPSEFSTRMTGCSEITVFSGTKGNAFREGLEKFVEEARKLATFSDIDGIVKIYDCFEENQTAYIIMEYLEGETLEERLKRDKKIDAEEAVGLCIPLMEALANVHKAGIIHRDISPDNIYIASNDKAKLLDFGSARTSQAVIDESRTVIVKKGYSPEEQYESHSVQNSSTDVYAMAATLYRMISGEMPPDALERRRSIKKNKKDMLCDLSKGQGCSAHLEKAIKKAMAVDMDDRTPSMESFIDEIKQEKKTSFVHGLKIINFSLLAKKRTLLIVSTLSVILVVVALVLVSGALNSKNNKEKQKDKKVTEVDSVVDDKDADKQTELTEETIASSETPIDEQVKDTALPSVEPTGIPAIQDTTGPSAKTGTKSTGAPSASSNSQNLSNNQSGPDDQNSNSNTTEDILNQSSTNTPQNGNSGSEQTTPNQNATKNIASENDFKSINVNLSANYILTTDITISTVNQIGTSSSQPFSGTFDGNGHTITINSSNNKKTYTSSCNYGLFGYVSGTIKNVTIAGSYNCDMTVCSTNSTYYMVASPLCARLVGGTITKCVNNCDMKIISYGESATNYGHLMIGGICGYISGSSTISSCTNKSKIHTESRSKTNVYAYTGGIVGKGQNNTATIKDCISDKYGGTDGILARVENYSNDETNGWSYCGGIIGYSNNVKITGCKAYCYEYCYTNVPNNSANIYIGGIVGWTNCSPTSSKYGSDISYLIYGSSGQGAKVYRGVSEGLKE